MGQNCLGLLVILCRGILGKFWVKVEVARSQKTDANKKAENLTLMFLHGRSSVLSRTLSWANWFVKCQLKIGLTKEASLMLVPPTSTGHPMSLLSGSWLALTPSFGSHYHLIAYTTLIGALKIRVR